MLFVAKTHPLEYALREHVGDDARRTMRSHAAVLWLALGQVVRRIGVGWNEVCLIQDFVLLFRLLSHVIVNFHILAVSPGVRAHQYRCYAVDGCGPKFDVYP